MRGTEVMSPENYSYAAGIFISKNVQRNEGVEEIHLAYNEGE